MKINITLISIKYFLYAYVFFVCTLSFSQELIVTGKILNDKDKTPVPFANIGFLNSSIGTVTNDNGEFEFHFPSTFNSDSIRISCIGFFNHSIAVNSINTKQTLIINIKPREYLMEAVTIRSTKQTPLEILKKAWEKIPNNYITKPYKMDGFYREYFKENGKFAAFSEAALGIYDGDAYSNISPKGKETIAIEQIRVSDINNKGDYVLYISINYALRGNLLRNSNYWSNYFEKANFKIEKLAISNIDYFENDLVYCIDYALESRKKGSYSGKIYVRTRDFAVIKIEFNTENKLKGREINGSPLKTHSTMTYKEHNGKFYLNYINASHEVAYKTKNNEKYNLTFFSELLINNVYTEKVTPSLTGTIIEDKSIFYQPRYRSFDPEFWENFNLFEESDANNIIIQDLEKNRDLELQYKANGKLKVQKKDNKTQINNTQQNPVKN